MHGERCDFSWWEDIKEMTVTNSGAWALYCIFGTSGSDPKILECHLMKKRKAI